MYLPKHDNFDKYTPISKDTGNERTWSLKMIFHLIILLHNGNDRLGLDSTKGL